MENENRWLCISFTWCLRRRRDGIWLKIVFHSHHLGAISQIVAGIKKKNGKRKIRSFQLLPTSYKWILRDNVFWLIINRSVANSKRTRYFSHCAPIESQKYIVQMNISSTLDSMYYLRFCDISFGSLIIVKFNISFKNSNEYLNCAFDIIDSHIRFWWNDRTFKFIKKNQMLYRRMDTTFER